MSCVFAIRFGNRTDFNFLVLGIPSGCARNVVRCLRQVTKIALTRSSTRLAILLHRQSRRRHFPLHTKLRVR